VPRQRSEGPKKVVSKLKDGSTWAYFYDRKTGTKIGQERLDNATEGATPGSVAALIEDYRRSTHFKSRKPGTQEIYGRSLDFVSEHLGPFPVQSVRARDIQELKDFLQDTPSKANQVLAVLSIIFKHAVKRGAIEVNPAASPGKLEIRPRTQIWSYETEERYLGEFRPSLKLAFHLMLYTLQRLSDCLAMTTRQITEMDGRLYVVLTQAKTDTMVAIPIHRTLEPLVRERMAQRVCRKVRAADGTEREVETTLLVPSPHGKLWSRRNASRAWDHDMAAADEALRKKLEAARKSPEDIEAEISRHGEQRRDLRRTGIVRLAERGATTPQIAAISGHSIDYCQRIIDTYLPRRTEVALGGIEAWEKFAPRVVRMPDAAREEFRGQKVLFLAPETENELENGKRNLRKS
jgi:integrase